MQHRGYGFVSAPDHNNAAEVGQRRRLVALLGDERIDLLVRPRIMATFYTDDVLPRGGADNVAGDDHDVSILIAVGRGDA